MAAKRHRIADLLRADTPFNRICELLDVKKTCVYEVRKKLRNGTSLDRKPGSGGHNLKQNEDFLTGLASEIEAKPDTSMRELAKVAQVDEKTIRTAVKSDLSLHSYVRRRRPLLTQKVREVRYQKGKKLLGRLKGSSGSIIRIFSDKKLWTVDRKRNARNDCWLAYHVEGVPPINVTKHLASAMMLGVVASDGKRMPPYWFPKGLRINTKMYLEVMEDVVKPWIEANYPEGNYVWQQDSSPAHKSKATQKWCEENLSRYWEWGMWPPFRPDLNPLDYGIWGFIESKACDRPHNSVADLRASVDREWAAMPEAYVVQTCKAFRRHLEAMLAANGGHFEK